MRYRGQWRFKGGRDHTLLGELGAGMDSVCLLDAHMDSVDGQLGGGSSMN